MSENEKANTKRNLILGAIQNLNDNDILENDNFTFWGIQKKLTFVANSHGGSHPPNPPPPPPGGEG